MVGHYPELPRREIEALGINTSYYVSGARHLPTVVLLHGMTSSGDAFRELMYELSSEFRLIAPDIPGFGHSDETKPYTIAHLVEWFASFKEALDLAQINLIGHSFGGALAAAYTAGYPGDVARLVLVSPAILAANLFPEALKRLSLSLGLIELGSKLARSVRIHETQLARPFYDPDKIDESMWPRRRRYFEMARASGDVLKALAFQNMIPQLRQIHQPVCIVWGDKDPVLPAAQVQEIAGYLPDARVIIWDKCGHVPYLEYPDRFLETTRSFFHDQEDDNAT